MAQADVSAPQDAPAAVEEEHDEHLGVPPYFLCPITHDIMSVPVILLGDGQSYEKVALEQWLAENELSPSNGTELKSKQFSTNWALKRIIEDWQQNQATEELQANTVKRLEAYLRTDGPYSDLLDIDFYVGPDRHHFRCLRAMMSSLCPFLKKMLNEDQSITEFEVSALSPDSFEQVLRMTYNLEPEIDSENVLEMLTASNVLELDMLKEECLLYLSDNISIPKVAKLLMEALEPNNDYGITEKLRDEFISMLVNRDLDGTSAMTVFNSALALQVLTPELEAKICKIFLTSAEEVVGSPSFMFTRLELMQELVGADVFCVSEDLLWKRVCLWAQKQAELEAADAGHRPADADKEEEANEDWEGALGLSIMPDDMQAKLEKNATSTLSEDAMKYLRPMIQLFRFPLMDREFFVKEVSPLLAREMVNNVLVHWVNPASECMFPTTKRADLSGGGGAFTVVASNVAFDKAQTLPDVEVESAWSRLAMNHEQSQGKQWFVCDCMSPVMLLKFDWKNYYEDDDTIHTVELHMLDPDVEYTDAVAQLDDNWEKIQDIEIEKTTSWQNHAVTQPEGKKAQYFKFIVTSVYGSEGRYTCLNHLKLHYDFNWSTSFANKLPDS